VGRSLLNEFRSTVKHVDAPQTTFAACARDSDIQGTIACHYSHVTAPRYLSELCTLVADVSSRRHLRSVCQNELMAPCHKLSSAGQRAFSVAPHRSGILRQIICMIRLFNLTVLGASQRHSCLHTIRYNVPSTLDCYDYVLHKVNIYLLRLLTEFIHKSVLYSKSFTRTSVLCRHLKSLRILSLIEYSRLLKISDDDGS